MFVWMISTFLLSQCYCFNDRDIEIISSLNQRFKIKQCIFSSVKQQLRDISVILKEFSKRNLYSLYLNLEELFDYLLKENLLFVKATIVFKANNDSELKFILEKLKVKESYENIYSKFTWLLILPYNAINITEKNFYVPFNVEFFLINENESKLIVTEIWQVKKNLKMIHSQFGHFHNKSSFSFNEKNLYQRRNNLQGRTLIMDTRDGGHCHYPGECFQFEVWSDLGKMLNFSTEVIKQRDILSNGSIVPDASSIGEILHSVTSDKQKLLGPVLRSKIHLYIRDTGKNEKIWEVYLKPFEQDLWIAVASWVFISTILFIMMGWLNSKFLVLPRYDLTDFGLSSLTVLCYQGINEKPENISSQLAKMAPLTASVFLLPAYSAFLISFLTVDKEVFPFTDFESFVKDGTYKLTSLKYPFVYLYFKEANDPLRQKIGNEYLVDFNDFAKSHEEAIDMICNQDKLSVLNANYYMLKLKSPCTIKIVSKTIMTILSAIKLGNETVQYKHLFLKSITKYRSAGLISNIHKKLFKRPNPTKITKIESIDINTTKSLFVLLMAKILISILLLYSEKLYHRLKCSSRKSCNYKVREPNNIENVIRNHLQKMCLHKLHCSNL